jgi:putative flippase GtrA
MEQDKSTMEHMEVTTEEWMDYSVKSLANIRCIYRRKIQLMQCISGRNSTFRQLSKFGMVGILNTLVGYSAFFILVNYTNYMVSLIISHIIGVTHSYIWNKYWIFKSDKIVINEFLKFNSVYILVFITNALVLVFCVNALNLDPRIGQLIALPMITMISFTGHKYWSFRKG